MDLNKTYLKSENRLLQYMMQHGFRQQPVLEDIRKATFEYDKETVMMVDELEAQLFRVMLKLINAKKCIEVGVYTGYNCANMALAIPDDGKVVGLDVSEEYVNVGKKIWAKHNLDKKIDVIIGDARQSMQTLIDNGEEGTYDFIFIDADKTGYDEYYEKGLKLVRKNGIIAVDNVHAFGGVINDESTFDDKTHAIHTLNKKIVADDRVEPAMIAVGDGVMFCRKK